MISIELHGIVNIWNMAKFFKLSCIQIHAFCGAWGLITGGLFATQKQ